MTHALQTTAMPDRLEAERVYLRRYRMEDAVEYRDIAIRNRDHLATFESGNAAFGIRTVRDSEEVLASIEKRWSERRAYFLGVFRRSDDAFVGQLYIGVADPGLPSFSVGYFADCEQEGHGYISEALRTVLACLFGTLGAHRVSLGCSDRNTRSAQVAERCGFVREGHLREDRRWSDGTYSGSYCYGMLADEFARLSSQREDREAAPGAAAGADTPGEPAFGVVPGPATSDRKQPGPP